MATADQIKSLIATHFEGETERFTTVALQVAAHEAKMGHIILADEIRKLVDQSKLKKNKLKSLNPDLEGLVLEIDPNSKLSDLIVADSLSNRIKRVINEFRQKDKLRRHDLQNRRKLLLSGPPGTGKTMSASVIANELHLPLYIILVDKLVTKYMGETSAKLRQVFDFITEKQAVYLFDEFDAIGGQRSKDNDVGEMRRVLNSFLQFIEIDQSDSLIIAATNNLGLLDQALFRRFDDVLHYALPSLDEKNLLLKIKLGIYANSLELNEITEHLDDLSHAEICQSCLDAIKECVLSDNEVISSSLLIDMIEDKKQAYHKQF